MKKLTVCFLLLVMLLSLIGCERKAEDLPVAESAEERMQQQAEQENKPEGGKAADTLNESEKAETDLPQAQPEAGKTIEYPDGIQLKKIDGESFLSFDHSAVLELPMDNSAYLRADKLSEKSEKTYSSVMKKVGDDGLIVAGYASGLRETHDGKYLPHTLTDFNVTDVYFGKTETSKLKISEGYELCEEGGEFIISFFSDHLSWLENGKQVLLFLSEGSDGYYVTRFDPIPLSEDYRNYDEEYETSLLDFFRGKRSEYLNQTATNEPQEVPSRVLEDGSIEYYFDASSYKPTFSWPQRDVSDEELLAELDENIILRTAMDYKIVIWPYGHKNAGAGYRAGDFAKASMP